MESISSIRIYAEHRGNDVDYESIAGYVTSLVPRATVELLPPLLDTLLESKSGGRREELLEDLARAFAHAKVRDLSQSAQADQRCLPGEIAYERRRLADSGKAVFGLLYDAFMVSEIYSRLLGREWLTLDRVNIIFTNQLIGSWDEADRRYHARVVLCGAPAVISLSGLVVAPAKSREYYLARQGASVAGFSEEQAHRVAEAYADDYLEHNDARLTEIAKGYVMQAVAYRMTGEPFCGSPGCRLYNAHWQKELLEAQLDGNDFCERHSALFGDAKD